MVSPVGKTVWLFLIKLNAHLLCASAVLLLVLHPREIKVYIHFKKKKSLLCLQSSETGTTQISLTGRIKTSCGTSTQWNVPRQ